MIGLHILSVPGTVHGTKQCQEILVDVLNE